MQIREESDPAGRVAARDDDIVWLNGTMTKFDLAAIVKVGNMRL